MRRGASAIILLAVVTGGRGGDPVIYPQNQPVSHGWVTTASAWSHANAVQPDVRTMAGKAGMRKGERMVDGGCGTCGDGSCEGERGNKLLRLIDFLCYKPSIPCDCGLKTTRYTPPLYMWFPNSCHATGACGAPACVKNRGKKKEAGGCATCGACGGTPVLNGTPVPMAPTQAPAQPPVAPTRPQQLVPMNSGGSPIRPTSYSLPTRPSSFTPPNYLQNQPPSTPAATIGQPANGNNITIRPAWQQ